MPAAASPAGAVSVSGTPNFADRRVRTRETDPGDHHGTRHHQPEENAVRPGES